MTDKTMKKETFEELLLQYGSDIESWPQQLQLSATLFAQSKAGKALLDAELALDGLFEVGLATGHEHIEDRNAEAFLARLEDVPVQYPQAQSVEWFQGIRALLASFEIEMSPAAIASQMAGLVIALGMGVFVGFSASVESDGLESVEPTEVDISSQWFSDDDLDDEDSSLEDWGA